MAKKNGGGGSQLAQLKARLAGEGISDRRQMKQSAKKRKRGQASSERDEQQARREKLQRIAESSQFNPFEEKITKPKNVVLGRHIRGAVGKPGEARQGGLRDRKENLLPEWKNRNKSGSFVDRRFGEGSGKNMEGMNMEDAMLERFTRERQQRANKMSMFNLDDAEEEGLTHYGRSLNDLDEYDDIHLSDEETGEDRMAHFGGFGDEEQANEEEDEDRQKTKAEVMKEVMAKSKAHKMERQQIKMQDEDLRQQLDDDFGDLRSLLMGGGALPEPAAEERKELPSAESAPVDPKKAKENAYDAAVREMVFERRAKPQDRLKTEAEKAQELAEKLQKAEDQRLRRMRGEEIEDEKGNDRKGRRGQPAGGDDLEDDFELDGMTSRDVYGLGQGLRGEDAEDDEEEDAEEEDEDEEVSGDAEEDEGEDGEGEVGSDEAEEDDDFDDLADMKALAGTGEDMDTDAEAEPENIVSKSTKKGSKAKTTHILPFTFPCPATLDELLAILSVNKVEADDVPVVIKRIRAVHHSSLAEDNKFKLQTLLGVLLDYILHVFVKLNASNKSETMNTINSLVPQLYTLTKTYPVAASEHFVGKLALMQRNLTRGLSKGALNADARTWPGVPECILLKVTSTVWPTSDRSHPVTTPLALLVCQYLSSCRVRNVQDIIKGLFLSSLVAENERQSRRLVPEALNFLHNSITLLLPSVSIKQLSSVNRQFGIPWPDIQETIAKEIRLGAKVPSEAPIEQLDFVQLIGSNLSALQNAEHDAIKSQALVASMTLVEEFARLYSGSIGFVELFKPFDMLLSGSISKAKLPAEWLEQKRNSTHEKVSRMVNNTARQRRALRLQAHRAIPIASHVPKFDQGFNPERKGGRTFDPDAQRAEVAKLRALAKKERKGAMRELRRDNEFLADARREAREEEDSRYAKQIDKIMGSFSAERGEEKAYLREKQKIKRRAGKK